MDLKYQGKMLSLYVANEKERVILVDGAIVIPYVKSMGKFIMVENYRNERIGVSLEFPGGKSDKGEEPIDTALRELLEETGYTGKLDYLQHIYSAPAVLDSRVTLYICQDAHFARQPIEKLKLRFMTYNEIMAHKFEDAAAAACVNILRQFLTNDW